MGGARGDEVRRSSGPWHGDERQRLLFEARSRGYFPGLRGFRDPDGRGGWGYVVTIDVPHYETRRVVIVFKNGSRVPHVWADGPEESPHRYSDNGLCMWYPDDSREMKWRFEDGLHSLLALIAAHLFMEAWWRENDFWLGPEVGHAQQLQKP